MNKQQALAQFRRLGAHSEQDEHDGLVEATLQLVGEGGRRLEDLLHLLAEDGLLAVGEGPDH